MKICSTLRPSVIVALLAIVPLAYPCSWAIGYFQQVTRLRGTVVGVNKGDLRHMSRWLRQRVVRGDVQLTLYEYRWPLKDWSEMRVVKKVGTDKRGDFDFGTLQDGHYTLVIDAPWGGTEMFDVQVVQLSRRTASVTIDISPVYPDCKGGHEFIAVAE
jgi:hypothetical protein